MASAIIGFYFEDLFTTIISMTIIITTSISTIIFH